MHWQPRLSPDLGSSPKSAMDTWPSGKVCLHWCQTSAKGNWRIGFEGHWTCCRNASEGVVTGDLQHVHATTMRTTTLSTCQWPIPRWYNDNDDDAWLCHSDTTTTMCPHNHDKDDVVDMPMANAKPRRWPPVHASMTKTAMRCPWQMPWWDDNDNSCTCMPARQRQQWRDAYGKCQGETTTTTTTTAMRARLHNEDNSSMCTPAWVTHWVFLWVDPYLQDGYGFSTGLGAGRHHDTHGYTHAIAYPSGPRYYHAYSVNYTTIRHRSSNRNHRQNHGH